MKKRLIMLLLVLLGLGVLGVNHRIVPERAITLQQKSSHMIQFLGKTGRTTSVCTVTAVGPHAIMTAMHCNWGVASGTNEITLDMSTRHYHILLGIADGRDHIIYLIDGPPLQHYLPAYSLINVKPTHEDEKVYIFGDGGQTYPPRKLEGQIDIIAQRNDVSDVDSSEKMTWYTLQAIPGDSGAAIFGADGRVVGLVTYRTHEEDDVTGSAGFALDFPENVITAVQSFDPENSVLITALKQQYAPVGTPSKK